MSTFGGLTLVTAPTRQPVSIADARIHANVGFSGEDDSRLGGYIASAVAKCETITRRALMPQQWRYAMNHWPGRNQNMLLPASTPAELARWNYFEIPKPPFVSVSAFTYIDTEGNAANMTQGYGSQSGNYLLDTETEPARIVLPFSGIWPTTILLPSAPIRLTFLCGYTAIAAVVDVTAAGAVTWKSGDKFPAALAGTWVTMGGDSFAVASVADDQHLQLEASGPMNVMSNANFYGNLVPMNIRHAILMLVASSYENREHVMVSEGRATVAEVPRTVDDLLADYVVRFERR